MKIVRKPRKIQTKNLKSVKVLQSAAARLKQKSSLPNDFDQFRLEILDTVLESFAGRIERAGYAPVFGGYDVGMSDRLERTSLSHGYMYDMYTGRLYQWLQPSDSFGRYVPILEIVTDDDRAIINSVLGTLIEGRQPSVTNSVGEFDDDDDGRTPSETSLRAVGEPMVAGFILRRPDGTDIINTTEEGPIEGLGELIVNGSITAESLSYPCRVSNLHRDNPPVMPSNYLDMESLRDAINEMAHHVNDRRSRWNISGCILDMFGVDAYSLTITMAHFMNGMPYTMTLRFRAAMAQEVVTAISAEEDSGPPDLYLRIRRRFHDVEAAREMFISLYNGPPSF